MNASPDSPSRHFLYNPHFLCDEDLEKGFIVRTDIFDSLIKDIESTRETSPPPHHLIVGQRGMGKSTLLRRIGLELRREPLNQRFVPLNFPEEQHVEVDRLSKFWLNCLDSLADSLEAEDKHDLAEKIDALINDLTQAGGTEDHRERDARNAFREQAKKLGRRPVLLIDNFHLLLSRLSEFDHQLRGFFSEPGAPILVGAATTLPEQGKDHGKAFYDGFKPRVLHRLSLDEIREIIRKLAGKQKDILNRLGAHLPHLAALRDLTGGNPRTAHLLYNLFASGFSEDVFENLQGLIDGITPLYQSYLEQLSDQGQLITGVLAREQKPMTAQAIAEAGQLKRASVSPQLGRLENIGFIERVTLHGTKKEGYQIAERFFNIWYLLRFGSRRDRKRLSLLGRFLKDLYSTEELTRGARRLLGHCSLSEGQLQLALSLPDAIQDGALARDLKAKAELELVEKMQGIHERIAEILDPGEIAPPVFEFAELKKRLRNSVPEGASIDPNEFVELVIGSPDLLPGANGTADRNTIAAESLNPERFDQLVDQLRQTREQLKKRFGEDEETAEWFRDKLRLGILSSWEDFVRLEELIVERMTPSLVRLVIETPDSSVKNRFPESLAMKLIENWGRGGRDDSEDWHWKSVTLMTIGWHLGAWLSITEVLKSKPSNKHAWNFSGYLLQEYLGRFQEAENAYRRAIEIDDKFATPWTNLGNLLKNIGRHNEAELAYREAIKIDPKDSLPWINLGILLQIQMEQFDEAEIAYRKAIEISPEFAVPWSNLGHLLQYHMGRFDESEIAYRSAIEIDRKCADAWDGLGNLLADSLDNLTEARTAYSKALELDSHSDTPRHNFAFFLRDRLNQPNEAREILDALSNLQSWRDTQALHRALFAAYDDNWGLTAEALREAIDFADRRLPPQTRDDWFRAAAVLLHLGFGEKFLAFLEEEKLDEPMLPFAKAIRAQVEGDREYLRNIAGEVRPSAEKIFDEIERRRQYLPESTRR